MSMEITPGPWMARRVTGLGLPGQVGWAIDYNEDQEQVVDYVYEEADARLIAAAPDLLEALDGMIKAYDDGVQPGWAQPYLRAAHAAIAKARGEPC